VKLQEGAQAGAQDAMVNSFVKNNHLLYILLLKVMF
jgi:hypothetical protein